MIMDAIPIWGYSSGEQTVAELLFGGAALAALIYCIVVARRERKLWPVCVFAGSALLVTYEPLNNFLGNCTYPTEGQHTFISYLNRDVPVYTWFIYMFYFSVAVPFLMKRFEAGVTMRQLGRYYAIAVLACAAFEPLFVNSKVGLHWWEYFGDNQALDVTGLPMWWWFANAMVVCAMAMIFHLLKTHVFTSDRQTLLFVPLAPLTLFAVHGSAAVPVYIATKSSEGTTWTTIATIATIAISALYMWLLGKAVTRGKEAEGPEPVVARPRERELVTS
jgi:hypothetical protein